MYRSDFRKESSHDRCACACQFHKERIIFRDSRVVTVDRLTGTQTDRWTDSLTVDNTPSVKFHRRVKTAKF